MDARRNRALWERMCDAVDRQVYGALCEEEAEADA